MEEIDLTDISNAFKPQNIKVNIEDLGKKKPQSYMLEAGPGSLLSETLIKEAVKPKTLSNPTSASEHQPQVQPEASHYQLKKFIEEVVNRSGDFNHHLTPSSGLDPTHSKIVQAFLDKHPHSDLNLKNYFDDEMLAGLKFEFSQQFIADNIAVFKQALDKLTNQGQWTPESIFTLYRLSHPKYSADVLPFYAKLVEQIQTGSYPFRGFEQAVILGLTRLNSPEANQLLQQFLSAYNVANADTSPLPPTADSYSYRWRVHSGRLSSFQLGKEHLIQSEHWTAKQEAEFVYGIFQKTFAQAPEDALFSYIGIKLSAGAQKELIDLVLTGQEPDEDILFLKPAVLEKLMSAGSEEINWNDIASLVNNRGTLASYKKAPRNLQRDVIECLFGEDSLVTWQQLSDFCQSYHINPKQLKAADGSLGTINIILDSLSDDEPGDETQSDVPYSYAMEAWLALADQYPKSLVKKRIVALARSKQQSKEEFDEIMSSIFVHLESKFSIHGSFDDINSSHLLTFYKLPAETLEKIRQTDKLANLLLTAKDDQSFADIIKQLRSPVFWQNIDAFTNTLGLNLNFEQIYAAVTYGWTPEQVLNLSQEYQRLLSLPDNTVFDLSDFDFSRFKPEQINDLVTLLNKSSIQEHLTQIQGFAKNSSMSLGKLIAACNGLDSFITMLETGDFSKLSSIPDFSVFTFIEPLWFDLLIRARVAEFAEDEKYQDLTEIVEKVVGSYQQAGLEGENHTWAVDLGIRRDTDILEDQQVFITIRNTSSGPSISLEFKTRRTDASLYNTLHQIKQQLGLNEFFTKLDPVVAEAKDKLSDYWCQGCANYENVNSTVLSDLGINPDIYKRLINSHHSTALHFLSTQRSAANLSDTQNEQFVGKVTRFFICPELTIYLDTEHAPQAYIGYKRIDTSLNETDPKLISTRLYGIMHLFGITDLLQRTSPEAEAYYMRKRYEWHHKRQLADNEAVPQLEWQTVYHNYQTFVDPGIHKTYAQLGLGYLMSTMRSPDGVTGALTTGTLSGNERRRRGVIRGGASINEDINKGGADYAFLRTVTKNAALSSNASLLGSVSGMYVIIYNPDLTDRTDWFGYTTDKYGTTAIDEFAHRPSPEEYFTTLSGEFSPSNEICFKKGVDPEKIIGVLVDGDTGQNASRNELITKLKERGVTHLHGIPLEDCILSGSTYGDGFKLLEQYRRLNEPKTPEEAMPAEP